jgi:hypothetical protein
VFNMLPQLGAGGCCPRPRNDRLASAITAAAIASVACTMSAGTTFGSTWTSAMRHGGLADRARREHEVLGLDRERLSARQPNEHRRGRDADGDHCIGEARAEERGERDREDQERAREHGIGEREISMSVCRRRSRRGGRSARRSTAR